MARTELHDIFHAGFEPGATLGSLGSSSPLARIEGLAAGIAAGLPGHREAAEEIRGLVAEARADMPTRDEILEAIEGVCDEEMPGICASRIAAAVARLLRTR